MYSDNQLDRLVPETCANQIGYSTNYMPTAQIYTLLQSQNYAVTSRGEDPNPVDPGMFYQLQDLDPHFFFFKTFTIVAT